MIQLLPLLLLLLLWPATVAAQPADPLDQLLAEHPEADAAKPAPLPRWLEVHLAAPSPPAQGEPFAVEAQVRALLADHPEATFRWSLPKSVHFAEGQPEGPVPLVRGQAKRLAWKLVCSAPLSIVEGQLTLQVFALPPRHELLEAARALSPEARTSVEKELAKLPAAPVAVSDLLEVAVNSREGFVGFTPLVWGSYVGGDGFYVGTGSFMDTSFSAQDLVADAEKRLLEGKPGEAQTLLDRARVELRPGGDSEPLLNWEATNCEALCRYQAGDHAGARELWRKCVSEPAWAELRRYALYNLGEAARLEGKSGEAHRLFGEAAREKAAFRLPLAKMK